MVEAVELNGKILVLIGEGVDSRNNSIIYSLYCQDGVNVRKATPKESAMWKRDFKSRSGNFLHRMNRM
jgi:hypothetical protein